METMVYNREGKEMKKILLPPRIFEVPFNSDLVHQVAVSQRANQRQATAHTKDRGEVRGGGRKPWRQKGTGRARHGSIRSPIFKGGGVTFGPTKERVFKKIIPKKMRRLALAMILSSKAKRQEIIVLDRMAIESAKTKLMVQLLENLFSTTKEGRKKTFLIALNSRDDNVIRASRNIPGVKTILARDLNVLDLLARRYLVLTQDSIEAINQAFFKKTDAKTMPK